MKWIRVSTDIDSDPSVGRLAEDLKLDRAKAVGLCVLVLIRFPAHARDGDIAEIPATTLEEWAKWSGRPGAFDRAFRSYLCTPEGVVRGWEKHNGAAIRKADNDARRQADARESRKSRATIERPSRDARRDVARDGTRRDETTPTTTGDAGSFPQSGKVENGEATRIEIDHPAGVDPARAGMVTVKTIRGTSSIPADIAREVPAIYLEAYLGHRATARNPAAFDAELSMLLSGVHAPAGRAIPGAILGRALHEMAANSAGFNTALLRGYLRRIVAADTPARIADEIGRPLTAGETNFIRGLRALEG